MSDFLNFLVPFGLTLIFLALAAVPLGRSVFYRGYYSDQDVVDIFLILYIVAVVTGLGWMWETRGDQTSHVPDTVAAEVAPGWLAANGTFVEDTLEPYGRYIHLRTSAGKAIVILVKFQEKVPPLVRYACPTPERHSSEACTLAHYKVRNRAPLPSFAWGLPTLGAIILLGILPGCAYAGVISWYERQERRVEAANRARATEA